MTQQRTLTSALIAIGALVLAACGGGSDGGADESPADPSVDGPADSIAETEPAPTEADDESDASTSDTATEVAQAGDYEEGDVSFRIVNLVDEPVDLIVRTTGLVEAWLVAEAIAPGELSEYFAPPTDGTFVVARAGTTDLTCVGSCEDFLGEASALTGQGPLHTAIVYPDEFSTGGATLRDFSEQPGSEPEPFATPIAATPSDAALAVFNAQAATGLDFGLRVGLAGSGACATPVEAGNEFVGGVSSPAFIVPAGADLALHANDDRECSGEPVAGPFGLGSDPGVRTLVALSGDVADLSATVVELSELAGDDPAPSDGVEATDDGEEPADAAAEGETSDAAPASRDEAVSLLVDELFANFGDLDFIQAECAAELLVDAIGPAVLVADGELVDLDALGPEVDQQAGEALVASVDTCGIDPTIFDG